MSSDSWIFAASSISPNVIWHTPELEYDPLDPTDFIQLNGVEYDGIKVEGLRSDNDDHWIMELFGLDGLEHGGFTFEEPIKFEELGSERRNPDGLLELEELGHDGPESEELLELKGLECDGPKPEELLEFKELEYDRSVPA
jgi:hypothetical protein